jgi:hypothetical protein
MLYGTDNVPMHTSYVGDEQSPVYGALHMLNVKSLLGLRNESSVYYGPVFSVLVAPALVGDYTLKRIMGHISSPEDYRDYILWDWGGILVFGRLIMVLVGFLGIVGAVLLFRTQTINPTGARWVPYTASLLLASNYFYFEYASFVKHWVPITALLIWQIYFLVRIFESERRFRLWVGFLVVSAISFGISYLPILYQIILAPALVYWIYTQDRKRILELVGYLASLATISSLIVAWHPYAFFRILGLAGIGETTDPLGPILDITTTSTAGTSFGAYATLLVTTSLPILLIIGVSMSVALCHRKLGPLLWAWVFLLPATLHYVVFSIPVQHVTRYLLPTIVLLTFAAVFVLARLNLEFGSKHWIVKLGTILMFVSLAMNTLYIVGWERMMLAGPPDKQIISQLYEWQENGESILIISGGFIGVPHTLATYDQYLSEEQKKYSTWQQLLATPEPTDTPLLDVAYNREGAVTPSSLATYDHVVLHHTVTPMSGTMDTASDIFDIAPWTLWNFREHQEKFEILK